MNCNMGETRSKMLYLIRCFFLVCSFGILDVWLRVVTRWIGAYSIFELAPNMFTLLWAIVLTVMVLLIPSRGFGRMLYGILYFVFAIYAIVQYGAYLLLGKFLYFSDFMYAGEGADYASWVVALLSPAFIVQAVVLIVIGVIGIIIFPEKVQIKAKKRIVYGASVIMLCVAAMLPLPHLYAESVFSGMVMDPEAEYERFANSNYDMELTGIYQYVFRDAQKQIQRANEDHSEDIALVDEFFSEKENHTDNEMTGIFAGKNVIVFMLESIDDWVITEEDTPTLYAMMNEGINFTNMYTPQYSNGYTFNTEFAFNTSVYPYSNGNVAYSLSNNRFELSVASIFADDGYSTASFHEGISSFYNRGLMHIQFGYRKYHSYLDYPNISVKVQDDRFLTMCDELYEDMVTGEPFFSYVITYSAHLPYTDENELAQTALAQYPQYDVEENREVSLLRAKARLTDDMFAMLLERLDADGLLEDTVIVCFTDHYSYGLSDRELLQQLSEESGNSILENTPAFIYCAGTDLSMEVEKVAQITDLAPTILNLFGLEVPREIMGQDLFSEDYAGHVVFANGSWLTNTTYVKGGVIQWNNGMSDTEIAEMNAYVQKVYQVNDAILDSDYYAHISRNAPAD